MTGLSGDRTEKQLAELWQCCQRPQFESQELALLEHGISSDDIEPRTAALRVIVWRGRFVADLEEEKPLGKKLLAMALPHVGDDRAPVRAAAVAAVATLEPGHREIVFAEKDEDPWVRIARRYNEDELETAALNGLMLTIIGEYPRKRWWETAIEFARKYGPHPAWSKLREINLSDQAARVSQWLGQLLGMAKVPGRVDGLMFNYGYSSDVDPVFELSLSGQDILNQEEVFNSADYIDGSQPQVLSLLGDFFPAANDEPIVCAVRHVALASLGSMPIT